MKKTTLITVLLLSSIVGFSQARFGLRTGVSFADITNLDTKMSTNFHFGAILSVKVSEAYSLRPEITYSREGAMLAKEPTTIPAGNIIVTDYLIEDNSKRISIDFIDISFINKFTTKNNLNFLVGPFIGVRVDGNINDNRVGLEAVFPRLNVGVILGVGYDISKNFAIEARFKRGFVDTIPHGSYYWFNGDSNGNYDKNHSQVLQLGVIYKFELKKIN